MSYENDTIGRRIAALRKQAGMTQEQLADQLGVSAQAVSKWENDISCPDISILPTLASIFHVSVDMLLGVEPQAAGTPQPAAQEAPEAAGHASRNIGGIAIAIFLILLGVGLFVLRSFTGLPFDIWSIVWPAVLLGLGIAWAVEAFSPLGLGVAFLGFYFLFQNLGEPLPFVLTWDLIWPVLLILIGLHALVEHFHWNKKRKHTWWQQHKPQGHSDYDESNGYINVDATFTEDDRRIDGDSFVGGKIAIVFSGGKLDLTQARTLGAEGSALLNLQVVFGGYQIYLPRHIQVENRSTCVLGGIDIKGRAVNPTSTLIITGEVVFGGVEIQYV
ncbi:MAG: helix-turn-helix domain-containing protein [Christensenellaceae bacterium]|jgi:transcriptional regulator with XRE-family HTH domain|nr:helix-turn-helix domain-containing protein [Christensenellaceae bacterium]